MRTIAIDRAGRGALESSWIPTPGWQRARVRVEAGHGGDLGVRVRGRASAESRFTGSPPYALATLAPLTEEIEFDLDGAGAIQVIADVGRGRLVRVSVEQLLEEEPTAAPALPEERAADAAAPVLDAALPAPEPAAQKPSVGPFDAMRRLFRRATGPEGA